MTHSMFWQCPNGHVLGFDVVAGYEYNEWQAACRQRGCEYMEICPVDLAERKFGWVAHPVEAEASRGP